MNRYFGTVVVGLAVGVVVFGVGACGTANEQGIAFRALGYFCGAEEGDGGDLGRGVSLESDNTVPNDNDPENPGLDCGFLGLENNMIQNLNVERVDLTYNVPGATIPIPPDQFALSTTLGPSSGQGFNASRSFTQIFIVSPQTFEFLNQNRNNLPDPPFTMIATARAVARADSGDVFVTNPVGYEIVFFENVAPSPTPATEPAPEE